RYRYYATHADHGGKAPFRLSASEIEPVVMHQVRAFLEQPARLLDALRLNNATPDTLNGVIVDPALTTLTITNDPSGTGVTIADDGTVVAWLFAAAACVVFGVALNRFNVFVTGYKPLFPDKPYVPAIPEILLTAGFISILVLLYRAFVFIFPVLHDEGEAHHA
ncbi:MAG TPA: hypothetical protein PLQ13_13185, partial [Candidatus Krumholzibacteria bacterium]|nr:hypothetical protein [Candidatus Krumholzibacteria bacterium]